LVVRLDIFIYLWWW